MREIGLNKGLVTMVDDSDYDYLGQFRWFAKLDRHTYYVYRRHKGHQIAMHREIMQTPKGLQVDHRDWNGLNNQRSNLRNCTPNDNCRWVRPRSNTGYLGVSRHRSTGTSGNVNTYYTADIKCNGVVYHLYHGKNVVVAARAYDAKARELFGEFANLNFK
jgi:hypothetical protein